MSRCFVYHTSRLVNLNKKVDFDVELTMRRFAAKKAKRSIALNDFNKNLIVKAAKILNNID